MALIACPECKKKISETAGNCPKCGYQLTPEKIAEIKKKEQQAQKASGIGCLSIIAIVFVLYLIGSFSKGPDCWECAYKYAYCQTLVLLGKGTGSCESLKIPQSCWDEEPRITKMGYKRGVEDAENR